MGDEFFLKKDTEINQNQINWLQSIIKSRINNQLSLDITGKEKKY